MGDRDQIFCGRIRGKDAAKPILRPVAVLRMIGANGGWRHVTAGHETFAALARRVTIADLGGKGESCPRCLHGCNYTNSPEEDPYSLSPGTFVFLPPRDAYFNENSADFPQPNMLYHSVKG
jgi:hypothetical protein